MSQPYYTFANGTLIFFNFGRYSYFYLFCGGEKAIFSGLLHITLAKDEFHSLRCCIALPVSLYKRGLQRIGADYTASEMRTNYQK